MRAKFIRGQDPKDAMEIGDIARRGIESALSELKQNYGGEYFIREKNPDKHDNYLHYLEGEWITKEGLYFYLIYDYTEDAFSEWYVSFNYSDNKDSGTNMLGMQSVTSAKEWISSRYEIEKKRQIF